MPDAVMRMMKLRMPPGTNVSVGFEFECANKMFYLNRFLPYTWGNCPAVEFPLDGDSRAKPEELLPGMFGDISRELGMGDYKMPRAVRNIVWTKDAFFGDHGPDCEMFSEPRMMVSKKPNRGEVVEGLIENNGNCHCAYTLEYKTLPMHTEVALLESMIGAALTLREASKKEGGFRDWNVEQLFTMSASRDKCLGATHVTKAYVINEASLIAMLNQQNFGFCAKGWSKEFSGDKVFRTSFAEAYMLWRAMRYCGGGSSCSADLNLTSLCTEVWPDAAAAQADVEAHLLHAETARTGLLDQTFHALADVLMGNASNASANESAAAAAWSSGGGPCTPGRAVYDACAARGAALEQQQQQPGGGGEPLLLDPNLGFGTPAPYRYYGPGGGRGGDTTTKVGAMLSADGRTLFGLAEHRKDAWNTKHFKTCIYGSLRNARDLADGIRLFEKSRYCKEALAQLLVVDSASAE